MSSGELFLGIDVSTTAAKALFVDDAGAVVASATTEYPLSTPKPLWSEQDPECWWKGAVESVKRALAASGLKPAAVKGVGLTGQMHGLALLDKDGKPLRPAILWNDQRTAAECARINEIFGAEKLLSVTGNQALTGFTAPKFLWVARHEPELYKKARHALLPKDYLRYRMTGAFATDKADGAGMLLMDHKKRDWCGELLDALSIPRDWMPKACEGTECTGKTTADFAALTGIPAGTPVYGGGGDQAAGAVGVGAVEPGIASLALGTSGVIFASCDGPYIEKEGRLHAFCHSVPGLWHMMGVMLSAAGSLRWYRDTLAPGKSYDEITASAAPVRPGCEGLFFLPYLSGERTPHNDPLALGAFVGLSLRHGAGHLARAVLEGVAFGLRDGMELMKQAGLGAMRTVRVSGGGAKSRLWLQILADVLGCELATVNSTEGAAYGAALLAGVGAGAWADVKQACRAVIKETGRVAPDPERVKLYDRHYAAFRNLYPALRPNFAEINRLL